MGWQGSKRGGILEGGGELEWGGEPPSRQLGVWVTL